MRVFIIAAVLGTLAQPAWAFSLFTSDRCNSLGYGAAGAVTASDRLQSKAVDIFDVDPNNPPRRYYELLDAANKSMEQASNYANVYQAFCKD